MRDAPDADRADGIAVIAVRQVEKRGFLRARILALLPVLKGHLDGDFHGCRAAVRIENPREARRREFYEFFRELNRRDIGQTQQGAVRDPVELAANRAVDFRNAMPMHIAPHGRKSVEIAIAVYVFEIDALAARDDDGFFPRVVLHLRKGMPNCGAVEAFEVAFLFGGHGERGKDGRRETGDGRRER